MRYNCLSTIPFPGWALPSPARSKCAGLVRPKRGRTWVAIETKRGAKACARAEKHNNSGGIVLG